MLGKPLDTAREAARRPPRSRAGVPRSSSACSRCRSLAAARSLATWRARCSSAGRLPRDGKKCPRVSSAPISTSTAAATAPRTGSTRPTEYDFSGEIHTSDVVTFRFRERQHRIVPRGQVRGAATVRRFRPSLPLLRRPRRPHSVGALQGTALGAAWPSHDLRAGLLPGGLRPHVRGRVRQPHRQDGRQARARTSARALALGQGLGRRQGAQWRQGKP